jgi:hypothetical protein
MCASHLLYRSLLARVAFTLLFVLAWITFGSHAARGQQSVRSSEQPPASHPLQHLQFSGERPLAMV